MKPIRSIILATCAIIFASTSLSACGTAEGEGPFTVSGRIIVGDTGESYPGATVEFRNIYKAELHTTTDAEGRYSISLPSGVYNAFALDLNNVNAGFRVVDRPDSVVNVKAPEEVNFVAFPIS